MNAGMYIIRSFIIFNHLHKLCTVIEVCTIIYNIRTYIHTWGIQNDTQIISRKVDQVIQIFFAKFLLISLPHKYHGQSRE